MYICLLGTSKKIAGHNSVFGTGIQLVCSQVNIIGNRQNVGNIKKSRHHYLFLNGSQFNFETPILAIFNNNK